MITNKRTIIIKRNVASSEFLRMNRHVFLDTPCRIGSSTNATRDMIVHSEELKCLMPEVLGLDHKSIHGNWDKSLRNYFDSISQHVPEEGLKLEVGWHYDIDDTSKKEAIHQLIKDQPIIKKTEDLVKYVEGFSKDGRANIDESEKYKYATPINKADYILYRYCLLLGDVANAPELVEKAPAKIRLYLVDESNLEKAKKDKQKIRTKALKAYTDVISSEEETEDMIYALAEYVGDPGQMEDEEDKHIALEKVVNSLPEVFIAFTEDKNIKLKAKINKYVRYGILKKLEGTSIIVDADNPAETIGNNVDACINYFANAEHKDKVNKYDIKYKSLSK